MFYYLNDRSPYTNRLLIMPDGNKPDFILDEKVSLERLCKMLCGAYSHGIVLIQVLVC